MGLALIFAFCLSLVAGQSCNVPTPGDRRVEKNVIRVGTFNLAWLFSGVGPATSRSPWKTPAASSSHVQAVAQQILRTKVDVLAVHEVESCSMLDQLVHYLGPAFRYYREDFFFFFSSFPPFLSSLFKVIPGTDTATGQNSALVTKIDPSGPLSRMTSRVNYPVPGSGCGLRKGYSGTSAVSKNAIAHIVASTFSFDFVFAHFKSGGAPENCAQREAQAQVLRNYMSSSIRLSAIVAGDLNDWDDAIPDARGILGHSKVLSILKGRDYWNAGTMLNVANRSSAQIGLIDHVLLTSDLRQRVTSVSCDGSGYPRTSLERLSLYLSDHLPVVVTLSDGPAATSAPSYVDHDDTVLIAILLTGIGIAVTVIALALVARIRYRRRQRQQEEDPNLDVVETGIVAVALALIARLRALISRYQQQQENPAVTLVETSADAEATTGDAEADLL